MKEKKHENYAIIQNSNKPWYEKHEHRTFQQFKLFQDKVLLGDQPFKKTHQSLILLGHQKLKVSRLTVRLLLLYL